MQVQLSASTLAHAQICCVQNTRDDVQYRSRGCVRWRGAETVLLVPWHRLH
ncbi:hypothetical protein WOLCODRAFT_96208 [Wolfiporia cocos MD-104 SS10]|uniref:Uncharacterized protein n=1 Tax=Wolfiporia cocos (strain MD-104) TaxID=742152 RepID=A0A2H3JGS6_WOLCO|nr:hypothetical protein WOLCODRAFT_96208 [Wolfiporia cocos MD-104 SS10]